VLSKYPPEYSKTEWATEVENFSRQTVQPEKVRYEAHQKFLQDARTAYESAMTRVETLIAANQFEEALSILKNFPGEYQSVYGAQVAAKLKDALEKKEEFQQRKRIMTIVGAVILSVVVLLTVIVLVVRRSPAVEEG
jgi:thioredoxin-like negative regulator of GroEL